MKLRLIMLSGGLHTVSCVIGRVSLDFILALLLGHDECVRADWLAGYWHGVCVFVRLQRLCVRTDLWVCIPLPLVFLTSKTLTSSGKDTLHPRLIIIIQNYFFCVDYSSIIVRDVWKSQQHRNLHPPSPHILCLRRLSASPVVIFEYLLSCLPIRAHQS